MEKCLRDSGIDERNVHDDALVGGSTRIPVALKVTHEFNNGVSRRCLDDYHGQRATVMCVGTPEASDLLRVVRLLWAGRNFLLGQERGHSVRTN